jgi:hypothetical protein
LLVAFFPSHALSLIVIRYTDAYNRPFFILGAVDGGNPRSVVLQASVSFDRRHAPDVEKRSGRGDIERELERAGRYRDVEAQLPAMSVAGAGGAGGEEM